MPKADIRSFFAPINSKKSQQNSDQVTKKPVLSHSQKKRAIIIDSDSDEESSPVPIKRSKPSSEEKKSNSHKKSGRAETKSKYFECLDVSVNDIFKDTPIKRDTSRKIVKRIAPKEDKEIHFDKEFEEELANLDDTWFEKSTSDTLITSTSKEKQVEKVNGVKESPKKTDVANICRRSPRKNYSNDSESPKKKLKKTSPANGLLSLHSPEKSPKKSLYNKSPVNKTTSNTPEKLSFNLRSPEKSPTLFSKSPLNKGKSKTPEKSPYKTLSLTRGNKECLNREELSHTHNTNVSTTKASNDSPTSKESPKKRVSEKCLPNEISDFNQNKKDSTAKVSERTDRKVSERTDKKEDPVTNEDSNKNVQKDPSPVGGKPLSTTGPSNLWVERYKPTSTKQIIGQQGEKSCVNKLIAWLKNWEKNQSGTKKLVKPSPWAKNDDGSFFKAALLSGPPGVGKTTTAHLVCKELGFDVVEFNASDTRSKRLLHEEVSELLSTKSLSPFFTGKGDQVTKKHVLLMDEVDGMAGNEDRGGVQELISLIKQSRVPVICMCNDRNHPKIRSLSNYCFDLRFSKPRVEQIRGAMMSVCFKEKLKLKPDELADIITSANQDIRLVMNHLSMLATHKTGMANSTKHIKMGPWDIVRKIFSEQDHKSMTIHDKCDLFFHDYSVTPLFVHENYLNAVPHGAEAKNKIKKMELFARTAKSLSFGDITEKSIRSNNAWGLLPVQAVFSSLVPGDLLEGHLGAQINFPAWFGKNSRQTKMNRLVQELTVHSRLKISGNREAMNLDYVASLGSAITGPLLQDGVDGVSTALSVLSEYCLVREDMESIAELSTWPGCRNRFSDVDSKVKAAFTRAYNKTSAPTPYAAVAIKKGRGDVDTADGDGAGEEDDLGSQDVDEEEEGLEADGMIMVKKKPVGKKADKDVQPSTSRGGKASSSRGSKRGRKK